MTSSPGTLPPPYEAVVQRGEQGLGPVRLPLEEQRQFIAEFNQRYAAIGISLSRIAPADTPSQSQPPSQSKPPSEPGARAVKRSDT